MSEKVKKPRFVLELPLDVPPSMATILDKRFEIARKIYNALVTVTLTRLHEMQKTKEYKYIMKEIAKTYPQKKEKAKKSPQRKSL